MLKAVCLAVGVLASAVGSADEGLIGGSVVNRADWPEVVRLRQGNATCSGSVIGSRVVLTAAHCSTANGEVVPVSEVAEYEVHAAAGSFRARCTRSAGYPRQGHDLALCLADRDLPPPYAYVGSIGPRVGDQVQVAGFGCTQAGGGGGNDGRLRVGLIPVTAAARNQANQYWFEARGHTAVCFGDSGGPAFAQVSGRRERVQVGVTSQGNIRDLSMFVSLTVADSQAWIRGWAAENAVKVCGISPDCVH